MMPFLLRFSTKSLERFLIIQNSIFRENLNILRMKVSNKQFGMVHWADRSILMLRTSYTKTSFLVEKSHRLKLTKKALL